jgi:hypothetical protein
VGGRPAAVLPIFFDSFWQTGRLTFEKRAPITNQQNVAFATSLTHRTAKEKLPANNFLNARATMRRLIVTEQFWIGETNDATVSQVEAPGDDFPNYCGSCPTSSKRRAVMKVMAETF